MSAKDTTRSWALFQHEPLDLSTQTIRVLKVLPGPPKSRIECELRHQALINAHVCLSYMWGDEVERRRIFINGRAMLVRTNLYHFLRLARQYKVQDWLWIDAICINQTDIAERNHQGGSSPSIEA